MEKHHHQQQFHRHKDEQKSVYSETPGGYGASMGGTGVDYNKEEKRHEQREHLGIGELGTAAASGFGQHEKHQHQQQFNHHKDEQKSVYSETPGGFGSTMGGTGVDHYNKEEQREHVDELGTAAASGFGLHEKHQHQQQFNHHKDEQKSVYSETPGGFGSSMSGTGIGRYNKEEQREHVGELGTAAASGFGLNEKHKAEKDKEHGLGHKIQEKIGEAVGVLGGGGYAFNEHHDKKETRKEEEEAHGHGKKNHHFF